MSHAAPGERSTMESRPGKSRAWNLRALLAGLTPSMPPDVAITDLTLDSRAVRPGAAFAALPGTRTHGIGFAAQAVSAGARAILWEPVTGVAAPRLPSSVALVPIEGLTLSVGAIADRFFDAPSQYVRVAGVTGTNGKTTTAHVIAAALRRLGESAAYAGTLGYGPIGALQAGAHTTPDAITVHRRLAELRDASVRFVGMEVSSHALDQHRVAGVRFDTAVFTNLTRDHLDYHGTFEAYGVAKAKLFTWPQLQHAVINADDAFGRALLANAVAQEIVSCGHEDSQTRAGIRCLFARKVAAAHDGLQIDVDGSWGAATVHSRFFGDFNVGNLLAVLATLLGWGIPLRDAIAALEQCRAPPGRMETLSGPGRPLAIVDYAHTPDALEKVLLAARSHCSGKLTCVFGCGGGRDRGKRPLMAAIAERLADRVVVTDDNPRDEDGDAIVADIVKGLLQPRRAVIERDRAAAIQLAIAGSRPGDVVLIAGKGHEDYQIVGARRRHFSDRETVLAVLGSPQ